MANPLRQQIEQISREKNINPEIIIAAIEDAILTASKKYFKPEFLNRLDDIVVFQMLEKTQLIAFQGEGAPPRVRGRLRAQSGVPPWVVAMAGLRWAPSPGRRSRRLRRRRQGSPRG